MRLAARLPVMAEALGVYVTRRRLGSPANLSPLLTGRPGRSVMSGEEREMALMVDGVMTRARITCLWRAVVIATMLRRRGIAATVRLSFDAAHRTEAHAEVEVGSQSLRLHPAGYVELR